MGSAKDSIRHSLGLIQQRTGNNPLLAFVTKCFLHLFVGDQKNLWTRNSYNFKAHIPLLSDLDLTLFGDSAQTARNLLQKRSFFFLIGEINFYHDSIRDSLVQLANPYELLRDPILMERINRRLAFSHARLVAFLARQLSSDQKWLLYAPEIRIQKWCYLCEIMNFKMPDIPSNEGFLSQIGNPEIMKDCLEYLRLAPYKEVYLESKHAQWKYLFPQSHIWNFPEDAHYLNSLSPVQKEIMLEQLKWEFWGVGCHYYWLKSESSLGHLMRLLELTPYLAVSPEDKTAMIRVIQFIKQEANQAKPQSLH